MFDFKGVNKKEIIRIVYRAEITGENNTESSKVLLEGYAKDMAELDLAKNRKTVEILKVMAKKLHEGQSRKKVYSGFVPDDVLMFVAEAEDIGVKAGVIFKQYAPIKELGDKAIAKVKKKMYFPFAIFLFAVLVFNYIVGEFSPLAESGAIKFSALSIFVMDYYLFINLAYGILFASLFIFIPEKLPIVKSLFSEINGMLAVSTMIVLHQLRYASVDMIPILSRRFDLARFNPNRRDIEGLTRMLYRGKLLTDLEASEIRNSGSVTGEGGLKKVFSSIFVEKKENVMLLDEMLQEVVKNLTIFLISVPIFIMLYVIFSLFDGVLKIMGQ